MPTKQGKPETQGAAGRRSTRLAIAIPITLSGKDASGNTFKENSRTIVINKHGAKIATFHQLALGAEVVIENRALGRTAKAHVVWLGDRRSPKEPAEVGVQLFEAENIWGIEFPPEDWQEGPPTGPGGQRLEKLPAPPAPPAEIRAAPPTKAPERLSPPAAARGAIPGGPGVPEGPMPAVTAAGAVGIPQPPSVAAEAALAQLAKRVEETLEDRFRRFEERLAKLSQQMGFETQTNLQDTANRLEEKMAQSLEQRINDATTRLQASQGALEALLAKFQELHASNLQQVEITRSNVQNASFEALQAALEELQERVRPELEAVGSSFVEQTRQRVQQEASVTVESLSKEAGARLTKLTEEHLARSTGELQAQQARAAEQAQAASQKAQVAFQSLEKIQEEVLKTSIENYRKQLAQLSKSALGELQRNLSGRLDGLLETTVRTLQEKSAKEVLEELHKIADESLESSAAALQKEAEDTLELLAEELRNSGTQVADETKQQLEVLSRAAVDSLAQQAKIAETAFSARLAEVIGESQDKGAQETAAHLQKVLEERLEAGLTRLKEEATDATEEAADAVNTQVGTAAAVLKEWEDDARTRLQTLAERIEQSAKTAAEAFQEQTGDISKATVEKLRRESEVLVDDAHNRLQGAVPLSSDKSTEEIRAKLQNFTDELVESSATLLRKQSEEYLDLISEQVKERQERAVNEAVDAFRNKIAEILAVFQSSAKKTPDAEPSQAAGSKKPK